MFQAHDVDGSRVIWTGLEVADEEAVPHAHGLPIYHTALEGNRSLPIQALIARDQRVGKLLTLFDTL